MCRRVFTPLQLGNIALAGGEKKACGRQFSGWRGVGGGGGGGGAPEGVDLLETFFSSYST